LVSDICLKNMFGSQKKPSDGHGTEPLHLGKHQCDSEFWMRITQGSMALDMLTCP
jgi:hypothetical protein